jgi:hypothetical protein
MKYRLEGFYYGLLFSGFFAGMEYWQEGKIREGTLFSIFVIPIWAAWLIGNGLKKEDLNK